MKNISTTLMRKNISHIIDEVKDSDEVFAVGRRNKPEVLIIKFPQNINKHINGITHINANSASFDFLKDEPDIYSLADIKDHV